MRIKVILLSVLFGALFMLIAFSSGMPRWSATLLGYVAGVIELRRHNKLGLNHL